MLPTVGRQQKIPHVRTGKINLGADLLQRAEAAEKRLTNARVVRAHAVEKDQSSDRGGQNKKDQAAKTHRKHQRGPQLPLRRHRRLILTCSVMENPPSQYPVSTGWLFKAHQVIFVSGGLKFRLCKVSDT